VKPCGRVPPEMEKAMPPEADMAFLPWPARPETRRTHQTGMFIIS
jgi:hypothetical protein